MDRRARAEAAVLRAEDFPPGWRVQEADLGLKIEAIWADLTGCLGVQNQAQPFAVATSPTFVRGIATQAVSTVEYRREAEVQALRSAFDSPRFTECMTRAFEADAVRSGPEGGKPGPSTVTPLEFPNLGQRTSASRINLTFQLEGLQVPIFQDFLVIFDGETVTRVFLLNPGSAFPPELERTLVQRVVERA